MNVKNRINSILLESHKDPLKQVSEKILSSIQEGKNDEREYYEYLLNNILMNLLEKQLGSSFNKEHWRAIGSSMYLGRFFFYEPDDGRSKFYLKINIENKNYTIIGMHVDIIFYIHMSKTTEQRNVLILTDKNFTESYKSFIEEKFNIRGRLVNFINLINQRER